MYMSGRPRHEPEAARPIERLPTSTPRFLTVSATAELLGMSEATLYRAIRDDEFPALRIRGRYVVPGKVLDEMESAAMNSYRKVDAADWADLPSTA